MESQCCASILMSKPHHQLINTNSLISANSFRCIHYSLILIAFQLINIAFTFIPRILKIFKSQHFLTLLIYHAVEEVGKEKVSKIPESSPLSQSMLSSCFQTITDKIAISFQHKKEKAFCLKNESVFPGFIQQSGRGEVRRESVPNERTGGRMGRELGLTEMAAPPLSFLLSPAFSDSSGSV